MPAASSPVPSHSSPWVSPLVVLSCPRMGCSRRAAESTPTPRGGPSRFFRSALLTPQPRKKFLAVMIVYNQDTSPGWHLNTFRGTPISTSCHGGSKYKLPVSGLSTLT